MTKQKIPIYLKNDSEFGTLNSQGVPYVDAKLAIPSLNENDKKFALDNGLAFMDILDSSGLKLINSEKVGFRF